MKYLEKLANKYFEAWTSDGIDDFHADADEIKAWLKREDLYTAADEDLAALTDEEIEKVADIIAEMVEEALKPAPLTLQDLTGQESGIVIYDSGETIVCNWSSFDSYELPKLVAGLFVTGWEAGDDIFDEATVRFVDDFAEALAERDDLELLYDANGDMANEESRCAAAVYTLKDGTTVIAPEQWN